MAIDPHQALMAALKQPTQQQAAIQALFSAPPPNQYQRMSGEVIPFPSVMSNPNSWKQNPAVPAIINKIVGGGPNNVVPLPIVPQQGK